MPAHRENTYRRLLCDLTIQRELSVRIGVSMYIVREEWLEHQTITEVKEAMKIIKELRGITYDNFPFQTGKTIADINRINRSRKNHSNVL